MNQAAVMMAHAMAVYTGKPGVCFLTAGPGFTNGITGIAMHVWKRTGCGVVRVDILCVTIIKALCRR
jgi:hypothetical protein